MGHPIHAWTVVAIVILSFCTTSAFGATFSNYSIYHDTSPHYHPLFARQFATSVAPGINLRILAIGDSITDGGSSDQGNSYRLKLREELVRDRTRTVDFIGSRQNGVGNADNQHEGYGGLRISEVMNKVLQAGTLSQRPNVVLIHLGTNDMLQDPAVESYDGVPARLGTLVERVLCACPDAVVLVAKVVPDTMPGRQARNDAFNAAIPGIVAGFYSRGFKVRVVDHSVLSTGYLPDGIHPSPEGYSVMSRIWLQGLGGLPSGWITNPLQGATAPTSGGPRKGVETCKTDSWGWGSVNNDQNICPGASVPGDAGEPIPAGTVKFSPGFKAPINVAGGVGKEAAGLTFGDLDGDGKQDYLYINSDGSVVAYLNKGVPNWSFLNNGNPIAYGIGPAGSIRFADMTGDGKDDIVVFHHDGRMIVYNNLGAFGNSWAWGRDSPNVSPGGTLGFNDLLGDLDGDGRADLAVILMDGSISLHFQQGGEIGTSSFSWRSCTKQGTVSGNPNLRLVDIDGDGRADLISIDDNGGLKGWLNKPGGECGVFWSPIQNSNGMEKAIAAGAGVPASRIRLADLTGDGKADYLVVNAATSAVEMFENNGLTLASSGAVEGALYGLGAAVRLADLNGDGKDDYIAVGPNGEAVAFLNSGQVGSGGWGFWPLQNGAKIAAGNPNWRRHQIHFADLDGDGLADYIQVDDITGAITWFRNRGPVGSDGWYWVPGVQIASGVGPGAGARFADIDGDGRADFIYVAENGDATVFPNLGVNGDVFIGWGSLNNGQPVASGVNAKRHEVYFADMDGDGFADYVRIFSQTGAMEVFYGARPPSGPGWNWFYGGRKADGAGFPGKQIRLARMTNTGRPDYVVVDEATGALKLFRNSCSAVIAVSSGGGTTPAGCGTPPLPSPTTTDPGGPTNLPDNPPPDETGTPGPPLCTGSICTPCSGSSCFGCTGDCAGCSRADCDGCDGDDCDSCFGLGCPICRTRDCFSCRGPGCSSFKGGIGGLFRCIGPFCNICIGPKCGGCRGFFCGICRGSDCRLPTRACVGPRCDLCVGDCEECSDPPCQRCTGEDCGTIDPEDPEDPIPTSQDPPRPTDPPTNPTNEPTTCSRSFTISECSVTCTKTVIGDTSTRTNCPSTSCSNTRQACSGSATTRTSTKTTAECPVRTAWTYRPANPNAPLPYLCADGQWRASCSSGGNGGPATTITSVALSATPAPICNNEADFPGHADIALDGVRTGATWICESYKNEYLSLGRRPITLRYRSSTNYDYEISWRSDCRTSRSSMSLYFPLNNLNDDCATFLVRAYQGCNNGGVGGKVNVGCLTYAFTGGLGG